MPRETTIAEALPRLRRSMEELRRLGVIRSEHLVGDIGETYAALYYGGVELAPRSTPGYDLVAADGRRVQVKTLRDNMYRRGSAGWVGEAYDVLFLIRLNADYGPVEAIEVPREVVEAYYPTGRVRWGVKFAADPRVRHITASELTGPWNERTK